MAFTMLHQVFLKKEIKTIVMLSSMLNILLL